uniref:Uncharacterized protein orf164 n=1 Tax=Oryza sativa subsp. indica TaxID=39946 RepID=H5ZX63_ORYSI|nr:hypothetical protein [Oryza sativa Indica Group]AEZ03810.1 hypothetical protein [Oryza sativa Indica Group]
MPNLLLSGRAQQLHGPLSLCCCQRFPGPSRNSLLERRQAKPEGRQLSPRPSSFSMKNKSTSQSPKAFSLPGKSPPPSSSLSFSGKGYALYLNVGRHSGILLFGPRVNIGSNMIGGVLATPCVQYKKKPLGSCRDYKKRVLSCVALKKGQRRRRSSTFFLPPAPA